jgi:hypothetical protein
MALKEISKKNPQGRNSRRGVYRPGLCLLSAILTTTWVNPLMTVRYIGTRAMPSATYFAR